MFGIVTALHPLAGRRGLVHQIHDPNDTSGGTDNGPQEVDPGVGTDTVVRASVPGHFVPAYSLNSRDEGANVAARDVVHADVGRLRATVDRVSQAPGSHYGVGCG